MINKNILLAVLGFILVAGCYKKKDSDLGSDTYLKGRLFAIHPFTKDTTILSGVDVLLKEKGMDTSTFIYSRKTDDNGEFYFPSVKDLSSLRLYARTNVGGIYYIDSADANESNIKMYLHYSTAYNNLLIIQTIDDANGLPLPNIPVCFFSNPLFFTDTTCANSTFSDTTPSTGLKLMVLPKSAKGTFYVKARLRIDSTKLLEANFPSFELPRKNLEPLILRLK